MQVQTAIDIINVLQDKYGSPYNTDAQIVGHINMAINEYMNRVFPDNQGGVVNFEFDSNITATLQPLIFILTVNMSGAGEVTNTALNTALQAAASNADAEYFRIMSIGMTVDEATIPVKYIKYNNRWAFEQNYFKQPTIDKPRFTLISNGLKFYPTSTGSPLIIAVIKKPYVVDDTDLTPLMEFDDYTCYSIISIALKLAGISTRDEELIQDVRLAALQVSQ